MPDLIDPSKRSKDNAAMLPYWEKVAAIIGGEDEIKSAGKDFLPMMPRESNAQYDFRLSVAKFTNIYRDIAESLASKPFGEEVKLVEGEGKNAPDALKTFTEDVDGDGNNLTIFSAEIFFNGINDAVSWIFIDYPTNAPGIIRTVAEARQARLRPFWSVVLAINVLEVKYSRIGGESVLSYIRILEPGETNAQDKVRVFEREENEVLWVLYAKEEKSGEWFIEAEGILSIDEIPLIPFITGRKEGKRFFFRAALQDAVNLQMTLYKQESSLEYTKVMTAFPMLSASGVRPRLDANGNPEAITAGPQTVLYAPPDGDGQVGTWTYVEPNAQSLVFLQNDVKETKQDLRELGKQPLTAQAGLTVITTAYAAGKSKSAVQAWGLGLKDVLENALVITCKWFAIPTDTYDPEVWIHDDYDSFAEDDFTHVNDMRKNKDLSRETTWAEARRRGILSAEFDDKVELKRILDETPGDEGEEEFTTLT